MYHHIKRHAKTFANHMKAHHKKYLFSIVWGGLFVKLAIFVVTGLGISVSLITRADVQSGCYTTGQYLTGGEYTGGYFTGDYLTGGYMTGGYLTGGYLTSGYVTGCYMTGGYLTGGYLSGEEMIDQYLEGQYEEGCYTTGQERTGDYLTGQEFTGQYLTGGYRTGGYRTGGYMTGGYTTGCINYICDAADIQMIKPLSGNSVGGIFPITWSYLTNDCSLSGNVKQLTVQLRDHNSQRINIATVPSTSTGTTFDSKTLVSTGLYTITGLNASGVAYNVYTGLYNGNYTNLATGYKIRMIDGSGNIFYTGDTNIFTIDNKKPTLTGITVTLNGVINNYIGLNGIAKITFTADEELTGSIVSFRGAQSTFVSKSGLQYTYQQTLSNSNAEGLLGFSVTYTDLAGNTGFYTATGPVTFDRTAPIITGFAVSGNDQNGFTLSRQTNENTKYILNYTITGLSGKVFTGTAYGTSFNHLLTGITIGKTCNFQLNTLDRIGNSTQFTGKIEVGINGIVSYNYGSMGSTLASMNTGTTALIVGTGAVTTTGDLASFAFTLQREINKFNACRDSVSYREVNLLIQGNDFALRMPTFQKETVKKLIQAFTVFMVSKLKEDTNLTVDNLNLITKKFNNLLIILKLVRDDDNECKQTLSNYHIIQFQKTMAEFGINL